MLRLQSTHHLVPAISPSSSSSSSSHRSCSLRIDLFPASRRRRWRWRSSNRGDCFLKFSGCKASLGGGSNSSGQPADPSKRREWDDEDQFLQASLLVPETIRHYNLRKQGFVEETKWHSSGRIHPLSLHLKGSKSDISSIGHGFLRRFHSPTIFLKIACEGDLLLPIVVGEFAIERLLDTLRDDQNEEYPNQFQFVKNLVGTLGYEVKKVWITKRVVNTYYARIFLGKTADVANISIDSRPSDAINMANQFKAPLYVSKQIVLKDAIRIVYGTWRGDSSKTVYDVSLDSAIEGPDLLTEELDLVRKMNIAVMEERYRDAALWRDKLTRLRMPQSEP